MANNNIPIQFTAIDHIAIAVRDLEQSIQFFCEILGFKLMKRREIRGLQTGMISAEIEYNNIKFVLCQGTEPESQVSKLVSTYGPGLAHIALSVNDIHSSIDELKSRGLTFDTSLLSVPGLLQIFSSRDMNSGFSFEFISRTGDENYDDANIQGLFDQLEQSGKY